MKKFNFISLLLFSLSTCQIFADDFDEFFDGPEPPPDNVSIFQNIWILIAILFALYLFIKKDKISVLQKLFFFEKSKN